MNADRKKQFQLLCESWRARQVSAVEVKCVPSNFKVMPSCSIMSGLDILSFVATSIPPSPLSGSIETQSLNQNCAFIQQAVVICMQEQTTLWSQYITEIVRCVTRQFHESLSPSESQWVSQFLPRSFQSLNAISCRYGDALVIVVLFEIRITVLIYRAM